MVKLIAFYKHPENKEAFDEHYFNVHVPITEKIPGLRKMKVTKGQVLLWAAKPNIT